MKLFDNNSVQRQIQDPHTKSLLDKTIKFFRDKGLEQIKKDDSEGVWYEDFLNFIKENKVFYHFLGAPLQGESDEESRFDMWQNSEMNELLGYYGLCYWYCWQVSILGLGPIWMSKNEKVKSRAKALLKEGGVFAYGLSEKDHGADIYSTEMKLFPQKDGTYHALGKKYYIGNGNCAALISVFGKIDGSDEFVFFVVSSNHKNYQCLKKINTSGVRQAFVSEFSLENYPITEDDILCRGKEAFSTALNTVNVGKFQLGFASIGIATHALHESIQHASSRILYGKPVTDFVHVRKLFIESYCRLTAMKLYGQRACDYLRHASQSDRRYLLFNSIMKMKVTSEGEKTVGKLHEIIAAKGFEQDTYFEMAIRDCPMLPKLEGTVHVNIALINKFLKNYFFSSQDYPEVPIADKPKHDQYLFEQDSRKMETTEFPDFLKVYQGISTKQVKKFEDQVKTFRQFLKDAGPSKDQQQNVDFMLSLGEMFSLAVYSQLILENVKLLGIDEGLTKGIYNVLIKDFAHYALAMTLNFEVSKEQEEFLQKILSCKPVFDDSEKMIWENHIAGLA